MLDYNPHEEMMMEKKVARYGDGKGENSTRPFLMIECTSERFTINTAQVCIDTDLRFSLGSLGGHSPLTYDVLWRIYNVLPNDGKQSFISSEGDEEKYFVLRRNGDMGVAILDEDGTMANLVSVTRQSRPGDWSAINDLFHAMVRDNEKDPSGNPFHEKAK